MQHTKLLDINLAATAAQQEAPLAQQHITTGPPMSLTTKMGGTVECWGGSGPKATSMARPLGTLTHVATATMQSLHCANCRLQNRSSCQEASSTGMVNQYAHEEEAIVVFPLLLLLRACCHAVC
jgi:hypothetical protein